MKAKRLLSLLLTAALMLSMVTPVLAASAETELPRVSQTRLEETNEVVSIRLQAAGKLVYGSPFELSVVTRPADAQCAGSNLQDQDPPDTAAHCTALYTEKSLRFRTVQSDDFCPDQNGK